MMEAEKFGFGGSKHAATLAARTDVLALLDGIKVQRHGDFLSRLRSKDLLTADSGKKRKYCGRETHPPDSCKDLIRLELNSGALQEL